MVQIALLLIIIWENLLHIILNPKLHQHQAFGNISNVITNKCDDEEDSSDQKPHHISQSIVTQDKGLQNTKKKILFICKPTIIKDTKDSLPFPLHSIRPIH